MKICDYAGNVHIVRKYVISNDGEESVWSNTWYGRHVIGNDCKWVNESKQQSEPLPDNLAKSRIIAEQYRKEDELCYEKLIAFLSTDCGLLEYRWDEGLIGVDRVISFLKSRIAAASTVPEATDKNLVFKLSVFLGTRLDPNKKPMTFLANEIVEAFLLNKQPEQEIPIWYREDDMRAWFIHNQYSEQIATELAAIWARDLQGAFKKGWEKAKNDGKAGTFDYEYMKEPLGEDAIDFATWIHNKKYMRISSDNVLWGIGSENENYTTEQLYQLYKTNK